MNRIAPRAEMMHRVEQIHAFPSKRAARVMLRLLAGVRQCDPQYIGSPPET